MIKRRKTEFSEPEVFTKIDGKWEKPRVEAVNVLHVNERLSVADFRKMTADVPFDSPNASAVVMSTLRSIRNKTLGVYVLDDLINWIEGN